MRWKDLKFTHGPGQRAHELVRVKLDDFVGRDVTGVGDVGGDGQLAAAFNWATKDANSNI